MLHKTVRCFLFSVMVWLTFASFPAHAQQPSTAHQSAPNAAPLTVVKGLGKGSVALIGPWQFHIGDDPSWASAAFDDSGWEQLRGNDHWGLQGHPNYTGFAWYRLHVTLDAPVDVTPHFHILIDNVQDAYELYWNGRLIGGDGKLPPHPFWHVNQNWHAFEIGPGTSGVFAIRVWKAPLKYDESSDEGGLWNAPRVGSREAISDSEQASKYSWSQWTLVRLLLYCIFGIVAVLALVAWIPNRGQLLLFWIALCSALQAVSVVSYLRLPVTQLASSSLRFLFEASGIANWFLMLWILNLNRRRKLLRFVIWAGAISITIAFVNFLLNGVLWQAEWVSHELDRLRVLESVLNDVLTLASLISVVLITIALWRRVALDHSRWLLATVICIDDLFGFAQEVLAQGSRFDHWGLAQKLETPLFQWNEMPVNLGDLADYLLTFLLIYAVFRSSVENRNRQAQLEQEFKSARELQQVLIPETLPTVPGFALTSAYRPAQEVGGDFFQIIPLAGDITLIVLGDVSGKGLRAAMTVSLLVGAIHALAENSTSPANLLAQLNRRLTGRMQGGFVTCIALRVTAGGSCAISSAGHPGPFFNSQELALPGSLPLGLTHETAYEESTVQLRIGDRLSFFTDGLLEAANSSGELFGFARLAALFARKPTATEAAEAAVTFGQDDDITVLTLTRLVLGAESTAVYSTLKTLAGRMDEKASVTRS